MMWWTLSNDAVAAGMEAQHVIALRLMKLAKGDAAARKEAHKMVAEKMLAAMDATAILAGGGSAGSVLHHYRTIMRANVKRLSKRGNRR